MFVTVMVQQARRWIGPREVLQAAPLRMRVQFGVLVGSGVLLATVPVLAREEVRAVSSSLPAWVPYVGLGLAIVGWIFYAGATWAQFNDLKGHLAKSDEAHGKRFEALESVMVRRDKLDDKLELMTAKIDALYKLLERSEREWRDSLHGSKE